MGYITTNLQNWTGEEMTVRFAKTKGGGFRFEYRGDQFEIDHLEWDDETKADAGLMKYLGERYHLFHVEGRNSRRLLVKMMQDPDGDRVEVAELDPIVYRDGDHPVECAVRYLGMCW